MMKRAFFIVSLAALILVPGRARAQAVSAISQVLCTKDSVSVTRTSKSLVEGLHNVSLTWSASPSNPDYYNVYRGSVSGGPYARIASCVQQLSYNDNASSGQDSFYVVTAASGAQESVNSNEVEAQIPVFDSISVIPNLQELPAESLTTSDAVALRQVLRRSPAESLNSSVSIALGVTSPPRSLNLSQSLTTSDALQRSQVLGRGLNQTVSSSDSIAASKNTAQVLSRGPNETLSSSDSIATSTNTARFAPASDTLSTSDLVAARSAFQRPLSETLSISHSVSATVTPARSLNISALALVTSDSLASVQSLRRGPAETLSSADALSVVKTSTSPGQLGSPFWLTTVAAALPPQVALNWTQSASLGIGGSKIYRHGQQGGPYYLLKVFPFPITHFVDLSVNPGIGYCYVVTGLTGNAESPYSNEACSTLPAGVSAPSALTVGIRQGLPLLTWRQSATRMVTGNNLYRSTLSGGPYTLLHSFSSPATSFSDATAARGQAYFYVITAVAGSQESGYSNQAATVVP